MASQEFRGFAERSKFFAASRVARENPVKPVSSVPALVVPTRRELQQLTSRTPRRSLLTLPPVRPPVPPSEPRREGPGGGRFQGSLTPRASKPVKEHRAAEHPASARATVVTSTEPASVSLPQLTFSTSAPTGLVAARDQQTVSSGAVPSKAEIAARFRSRLTEYDDADEDGVTADRDRRELDTFEDRHLTPRHFEGAEVVKQSSVGDHHTVTTIDEEASTRVLKVMFQLNLTKNSTIISKLKDMPYEALNRKVLSELGYKKQLSRDEFFVLMCKIMKDDYVNKRDCMTLFSVFDDDKSGLVDAVEFVGGFMTLIAAGENDIAFKFIHTVLDSRGEKAIMNAFISRFEIQLLVGAAQVHFASDPDIVRLLDSLSTSFNFSHHLGRIPIMQFRDKIIHDEDLFAIFSALPNPSKPAKDAASAAATDARDTRRRNVTIHEGDTKGTADVHNYQHILADQYMSQNQDLQQSAEEHDSPRWWVRGGIVYRASDSNPYEEPVFLKDNDKRR